MRKLFSILTVVVVTQVYVWFKIHRIIYLRKKSILTCDNLKRKIIENSKWPNICQK